MAVYRSACPLDCWDNCSWLVTVENDQVTNVRGDPEDPYTRGFICPKARYQMERHLSPERSLHPLMKRDGAWERINWDEALDLLASKIREATTLHGPSSVFYYPDAGSMGLSKSLGMRLFRLLGASEPLGSLCWAAGVRAQDYDFGYHLANAPEDILNSGTVIVWGRNPAATNVHMVPIIKEARERGARLVLVDPVRSETATIADWHIQLRPATDAALALAMCNVIISEGLVDVPFVAAYTVGFAAFAEHVTSYTPAWAEGVTGVSAGAIADLARQYATKGPAALLMGYGFQRHYGGGNAVRACDALAALTGNVGRAGGGANYANGYIAGRLASLSAVQGPGLPVRRIPRANLGDLAQLHDPPVQVMVISCANPINQSPGAARTIEGLRKVPFKAALDLRWTETCEESDLFLPVATPFEDEDLHFCSWHQRLTYTEKCVEPGGEALPDRVIWQRLAMRLDLGADFDRRFSEWVDTALAREIPAGLNAAGLRGKTIAFPAAPSVAYQDCIFRTPSAKFEFNSRRAEDETGYGMATFLQVSREGEGAQRYPLRLLSPRRVDHLHSQFYEKMVGPGGVPYAFVSEVDLARSGLKDGDMARVASVHGCIRAIMKETFDVPSGVALIYEGGSVLSGNGVNVLTPQGETDMGHGPVYYDTFVRLVPAP